MIQDIGTNGLINRDVQGTALQSGNGIIEIAGIKIYKSMNVPFLGKHGVAYGGTTGETSPSNLGSHVGGAIPDGRASVTGINNNYGNSTDFAKSCGLIFQKEAAAVVEPLDHRFR